MNWLVGGISVLCYLLSAMCQQRLIGTALNSGLGLRDSDWILNFREWMLEWIELESLVWGLLVWLAGYTP